MFRPVVRLWVLKRRWCYPNPDCETKTSDRGLSETAGKGGVLTTGLGLRRPVTWLSWPSAYSSGQEPCSWVAIKPLAVTP